MNDDAAGLSRPRGVKILSILHLLAGIGIVLVYTLVEPRGSTELEGGLELVGLNIEFEILGWILLGVILVVSAVGLWLGRPWGWWSAGYLYVHRVLVSFQGLFLTLGGSGPSTQGEVGAGYFVVGFLIRIGVSVYVLMYLFHLDIRMYSGLPHIAPRRGLLNLVGVSALVILTRIAMEALAAVG